MCKDSGDEGGGGLHHTLQVVQHTVLQNTTDYTRLEYRITETALKAILQAILQTVVENTRECTSGQCISTYGMCTTDAIQGYSR